MPLLCQLSYVGNFWSQTARKARVARTPRLPSKTMRTLDVERLLEADYDVIKPLLVELHVGEQVHYSDHPQLSRREIEDHLTTVPSRFVGENVVFVVRDEAGTIIGFCWIVLYDPGTGLQWEVAQVYLFPEHRGSGLRDMLMAQTVHTL